MSKGCLVISRLRLHLHFSSVAFTHFTLVFLQLICANRLFQQSHLLVFFVHQVWKELLCLVRVFHYIFLLSVDLAIKSHLALLYLRNLFV
jgi:hypothetical protein